MKTLEELRARLKEISERLENLGAVENFTEEVLNEVNTLNDEFLSTKGEIEAREKIEAVKMSIGTTQTRQTAPIQPQASVPRVEVGTSRLDRNGGFKNFGEFLLSVKNAARGNVDRRFQNTMFEKNGEDGGFLVPEEMISEISTKVKSGDESLLSRCDVLPITGSSMSLPTDEEQPWTGGIEAYWTEEGSKIKESKSRFGKAYWRLHKLGALVPVTDELLEDQVAIESHIRKKAPNAMTYKINDAIIGGSGVGTPTGILSSDFRFKVAKEVGQAADTVVAENVIKMYGRMLPSSIGNSVWLINPAVRDQLRLMKDPQGNYIFLAAGSQMNNTPYDTLLGRPVLSLLGGVKQLGDEGDIMFVDLSYYQAVYKSSGIKSSMSTHLLFDQDKSVFKFTYRVDGSCPFKSPVVTQYGNYQMSGFVTLEDRA